MISKHLPAHSFYHTCRYISQKQGAETLLFQGVRGHDYKLMAADFEMQHRLRPSKTLACFHAILSFYPGEKPTDDQMKEIALSYLKELKITNTQYAVSKHTDKSHLHLHIVANMVDCEGKAISDSWIGLRGKKLAQRLTETYQLIPALEKNLKLTHLESLSESDAIKYKIYVAISENLPFSRNIGELEQRLLKLGITTQYKYRSQTNERQGISFKMGNISLKGSQIDRKFSYGGMEKTFVLQQELRLRQELKEKIHSLRQKIRPTIQPLIGERIAHVQKTRLEKAFDILLKPEQNEAQIAYELTQEAEFKQRKKSRQRLGR